MPRWMTYANVMSTIAVFLVLGGTAVAVTKISGKRIVNRSIPASKIKRNSLTAKEVRSAARSLSTRNLVVTQNKGGAIKKAANGPGTGIVTLQLGESATLLRAGPYSMSARCETDRTVGTLGSGLPTLNIWVETEVDGTLVASVFDYERWPSSGGVDLGRFDAGQPLAQLNQGEKGSIRFPAGNVPLSIYGTSGTEFMMITPTGYSVRSQVFFGNGSFGADCFAGASAIVSN